MKILSLTKYAYNCLSMDDIDFLEDCIGSETEFSIENDEMLIMPDGSITHKDFLNTNNDE